MQKVKGKIKWYNKEKGFGFIEITQDVFFSKSNLKDYDPQENDKVEFILYDDQKLITEVKKYLHKKS